MNISDIKFRGKCLETGKWVFGSLNLFEDSATILMTRVINENIGQPENIQVEMDVDPSTVGQFTRLQDKNGVDAYPGNLYEAWGQVYELKFCDEDCFYSLIGVAQPHGGGLANQSYMKNFTIIGNRFDNPDLLGDNND